MPQAIANRYALALAEVVSKPDAAVKPGEALEHLQQIRDVIASSQELRNVLLSPAVSVGKKRAILDRVCAKLELAQPIRNFLFVAVDHRRIDLLDEFAEAFRRWHDERAGLARARVTSALPLDEDLQSSVVGRFEAITEKKIAAEFQVDPALLGGAVVRIGSQLYDGSLRAQLDALHRKIAARG